MFGPDVSKHPVLPPKSVHVPETHELVEDAVEFCMLKLDAAFINTAFWNPVILQFFIVVFVSPAETIIPVELELPDIVKPWQFIREFDAFIVAPFPEEQLMLEFNSHDPFDNTLEQEPPKATNPVSLGFAKRMNAITRVKNIATTSFLSRIFFLMFLNI